MKKVIVLLALVAFAAGLVFISNDTAFAKRKEKAEESAKVEKTSPEAPEPKLVCSFESDEEMAEFEQLYVAKQATFGRMGVLQAYFAMEQNNLTAIDQQMNEKFGFTMDPSKMYDLNRDAKEIRELGNVTQAAPAVPTQ